jgi:hypothetical protein
MGMPQKEDYENHILAMKEGKVTVSFLLKGSSKFDSLYDGTRALERRVLSSADVFLRTNIHASR